jgi:hypothetical protein
VHRYTITDCLSIAMLCGMCKQHITCFAFCLHGWPEKVRCFDNGCILGTKARQRGSLGRECNDGEHEQEPDAHSQHPCPSSTASYKAGAPRLCRRLSNKKSGTPQRGSSFQWLKPSLPPLRGKPAWLWIGVRRAIVLTRTFWHVLIRMGNEGPASTPRCRMGSMRRRARRRGCKRL